MLAHEAPDPVANQREAQEAMGESEENRRVKTKQRGRALGGNDWPRAHVRPRPEKGKKAKAPRVSGHE
jgi:hypothetical protein